MGSNLYFGPGTGEGKASDDLKTCPVVGCPELIPKAARGCATHKNTVSARDAARRRAHPRNSIYRDPRWKRIRKLVFARDYWTCVGCGYVDFTGRTLSCDHVNDGGVMRCPDPFDPIYLATRCFPCSGRKDGARGVRRSA